MRNVNALSSPVSALSHRRSVSRDVAFVVGPWKPQYPEIIVSVHACRIYR